ncbi:flagellar basal body-associated FliL family protein [Chelativorans sp. Marseille-P2723]|uniref:flagellar basal body-associated FliL family protein n=1 Tax=Chelativorans sp. Marseille-P2723 TaxID=2709133 RepID=UPI001FEFC1ED|nr:flagellar basal body-associated FliL family protein [Chelativorans sp. Marseille-P2723]
MAVITQEEEKKEGRPLIMQLAALLVITVLAAGMGWLTGTYLEKLHNPAAKSGLEVSAQAETPNEGEAEEALTGTPSIVFNLDPITINLAEPADVWLRMELALAFDGPADPELARTIHQDLLAYMRTVKLKQIESSSGFHHLKADLLERARIRSNDRVKQVLVLTFLYE